MRIEKITTVIGYTLVVYYSSAKCYQFSVVIPDGDHHNPPEIFYSASAAETAGRKWIKTGCS